MHYNNTTGDNRRFRLHLLKVETDMIAGDWGAKAEVDEASALGRATYCACCSALCRQLTVVQHQARLISVARKHAWLLPTMLVTTKRRLGLRRYGTSREKEWGRGGGGIVNAALGCLLQLALAQRHESRMTTAAGSCPRTPLCARTTQNDGDAFMVPVATLRRGDVDASETNLWMGSYVAHPIAFVQPSGPHEGQWAYGAVTRYQVNTEGTWLSVLAGDTAMEVRLSEPLSIIKADPITYPLQDAVIGTCLKRRGDLPASVRSALTTPFVSDDRIKTQQHADQRTASCSLVDELLSLASTLDDQDVRARSTTTKSHTRETYSRSRALCRMQHARPLLDITNDNSDEEQERGRFRPSVTQRRISRRNFKESLQYVLERMQQSGNANSPRLPLVFRGLWEFGCLAREVTLMHSRPADLWGRVQAQDVNVSFTDPSERNILRATPTVTSRSDVSSAFWGLRSFTPKFYVQVAVELIDAALTFVERYRGLNESDSVGWKLVTFWITSKFDKFRSYIVSRDPDSVQHVQLELSRRVEDPLELLELRSSHRSEGGTPHRNGDSSTHRTHTGPDPFRRVKRQRRQSSVPTVVWAALTR
ncbi:hypothetical protein ON010_g13879 [Phytophthora cinnamomi]|nr:hypothetical protein ON010_g13879 [Phytophthora cinnamomi]